MKNHRIKFPPKTGPISIDQLTAQDRAELGEMAKDKSVVIDVGTFFGASAEIFLLNQPEDGVVYTIDTFEGSCDGPSKNLDPNLVISYAQGRLRGVFGERAIIIAGTSGAAAKIFPREFADLVFLDAAHNYKNVKEDIKQWLPVLKQDGVMAGHDFDKVMTGVKNEKEFIECLEKFGDKECDPDHGIHYGVIKAVRESFSKIHVSNNRESSIWLANSGDFKNG